MLSRLIFLTSGINSRSRLWNQTGFEQYLAFSAHICYSFVITTDCLREIGVLKKAMFKVKSRDKIALVLRSAGECGGLLVNSGYRIRSIRGSINQIQGKQEWFFFFNNLMFFDAFCLLFSEVSPIRVCHGAHIFPGRGKGISEKGGESWKRIGGAGVLARKTVKEVRVDFDLAGSIKSFKED